MMSQKFAFVEKSLELFEPWKAEHCAVMAAYDRADVLDQKSVMMTALFDCIEGMLHSRNSHPEVVRSSDARSLCNVWMTWHNCAREMLKQISELELEGYAVPRAADLRACLGKAGGWVDSVRKLSISLEEFSAGTYHSLDEAMDALRA